MNDFWFLAWKIYPPFLGILHVLSVLVYLEPTSSYKQWTAFSNRQSIRWSYSHRINERIFARFQVSIPAYDQFFWHPRFLYTTLCLVTFLVHFHWPPKFGTTWCVLIFSCQFSENYTLFISFSLLANSVTRESVLYTSGRFAAGHFLSLHLCMTTFASFLMVIKNAMKTCWTLFHIFIAFSKFWNSFGGLRTILIFTLLKSFSGIPVGSSTLVGFYWLCPNGGSPFKFRCL